MATKRKRKTGSRTRSRRRKTMSETPGLSRRRKTSRRRKKKGLSEIFTHQSFMNSGKSLGSGGVGGGISFVLDKFAPDGKPLVRGLLQVGSALVLAGGFDKPMTGAGIAGAYVNNLLNENFGQSMSEMDPNDYANDDALDQYPDALDENGNPMYLAEDGNFYYLDEYELSEDGNYYLSETMQASLYPGYVRTTI